MMLLCIPPLLWAFSAYYCYSDYSGRIELIGAVSAMLRGLRTGVCERRLSAAELGRSCASYFPEEEFDALTDFLVGHMSNEQFPPEKMRAYLNELLPTLKHWRQTEN